MFSGGDDQSVLGRRHLLATVGSVAVAGCGLRSSPVRIQTLTVENFRETAHEITVELRSEDEIVFEATTDLPPAEERSGKIDKPSGETWRPNPTLDTESILRYQIDDGEWKTKTLGERGANSENGCLRLEIELRSDGRSVIGWGYECFETETE